MLQLPYVVAIPSVCCHLSVMFVQPNYRVEIFGSITAPAKLIGTHTVFVKIFDRNSRGYMSTCKLNGRGMMKSAFRAIENLIVC